MGASLFDATLVAGLGARAVLAVTVGTVDVECLLVLPLGMVTLSQAFAAQLDHDDRGEASRYGWYALGIALVFGLAVMLVAPAGRAVIEQLGYDPQTRALLATYVGIRVFGIAPFLAGEGLSAWFAGRGNTAIGMWASLVALLTHVGVSVLLVWGHLGFPALGVAGAAWGHVLGSTAGLVVLLVPFVVRSGLPARVSRREIGDLVRLGVPAGVDQLVEFAGFLLLANVILARFDPLSSTAVMVVLQLDEVFVTPVVGIAVAAGVRAGQLMGGRRHRRVPGLLWRALRWALAWQALVAFVFLVAAGPLVGAFGGTDRAQLVAVGVPLLMASVAWRGVDALAVVTAEILKAAGDTKALMAIRVACVLGVLVPAAEVGARLLGGLGVVAGLTLYLSVLSVATWLRMRSGQWRSLTITTLH
ncbi:MAG: hypothetical protein H6734_11115 [Alphaproteobacteria bacterium]|nr:hypothetical protein [Alphaproteobacteria bacterium]